jgi:hypothetical protein
LLFQALYANDPYTLLTASNVVPLCRVAHKYACGEVEAAGLKTAKGLAKKCKMSGTVPTIPELLLLSQQTQNKVLLNSILTKDMKSFNLVPTPTVTAPGGVLPPGGVAKSYCVVHPQELLHPGSGCYYKTPQCGPAPHMDEAGRALLLKLSPKLLLLIIEGLLLRPAVAGRAY